MSIQIKFKGYEKTEKVVYPHASGYNYKIGDKFIEIRDKQTVISMVAADEVLSLDILK